MNQYELIGRQAERIETLQAELAKWQGVLLALVKGDLALDRLVLAEDGQSISIKADA